MPDDLIPDSAEPQGDPIDTSAADAAEDAVYDAEYDTAVGDTPDTADEPDEPAGEADAPAAQKKTAVPPDPFARLTPLEKQALSRAQFTSEMAAGMSPEAIQNMANWARSMQANSDRLGAELGRAQGGNERDQPQAKDYDKDIDELMTKLKESYDEDISPLGDALKGIHGRLSEFGQATQTMPLLEGLIEEMAMDAILHRSMAQYPSLDKPDVRQRVVESFRTLWGSGQYGKSGESIYQAMQKATSDALKMTFNNTSEAAAAAQLVNANKKRVASQPKVGSSRKHAGPKSEDDIYNEAFEATMQ